MNIFLLNLESDYLKLQLKTVFLVKKHAWRGKIFYRKKIKT
jgi:hypothetical protein